ncbi:hypothetical protein V493_07029, partial [Pseudogymnoascus sp. VKM F-4281 (FW-2241)]
MKVFSNVCNFDYSWEEVSTANWRKYCPWNDKSTHVVAVDTLSRHVDADSGILRTERLITCKQTAPKWLLAMMGGNETSHVLETSYVDPQSKKVTMCSTNLTFANLISVQETVIYRPTSDAKTEFHQEAQVTAVCGGWQKIKTAVEEATVVQFQKNAIKGREGFEAVLEMSRLAFSEEKSRQKMMALTDSPTIVFNTSTMEKPDEPMPYETDLPLPPKYEKADEIQEFDASGQLVTTVTVLRGSLVEDHVLPFEDSSIVWDKVFAKYPESRVDISIPTRSHSWVKSFMEIFLPAGYPNSVTEDYM